jgi:predicted  nucleic acid-binding Zn-ribbon protein
MKQQIEELNKELRYNERILQTLEDSLSKHQAKIYAVKTQKEMVSLDHEIAKTRQESSQTEDKVLGLMGDIENVTERIEAKSKAMVSELVELQAAEKDCQAKLNQTEQKLKAAKEEREKSVIDLPQEALVRYEKLLANKNNLAVVAIKGGACQGCFMILPPQMINEAKSSNGMVCCERCLRILYCEDEKR